MVSKLTIKKMTKQFLILVGFLVLISCHHNKSSFKKSNKSIEKVNPLKNQIIGIWKQKGSINADFQIDDKTFYYVDDFAHYKYSLNGNLIKIYYPDYIYEGNVSFKNDNLIISNKDGEVRYYRFKE